MRNPINVLNSLQEHSSDMSYRYDRLYRNLFNRDFFLLAYQNIYSSPGNMTKGSDGKTIDAMSIKRIEKLIAALRDESYQPQPARRAYIPKKNGKKRPLGIPTFDDKLVQEIIRMLLEAIYERSFENSSHGFRPKRSCHTALNRIQKTFTGTKWFVEGDIKGFFDNIHHEKMIEILSRRIHDERFLRLIRKFLRAGYLENWKFRDTYSGVPQGGIASPILANIYLDQLDKFMEMLKQEFDTGKKRRANPQIHPVNRQILKVEAALQRADSPGEWAILKSQLVALKQAKYTLPYTDPFDAKFRRLFYARYADDFLIGVIGSKEDALYIKERVKDFLAQQLCLELSDEKTLITHGNSKARFLGYDIYVRYNQQRKKISTGIVKRTLMGSVCLEMPMELVKKKLLAYSAMKLVINVYGKEVWKSKARYYLKNNDDLEILDQYNSEIRGFRNYYAFANNSAYANAFFFIMKESMFKTYATKYSSAKSRSSMRKEMTKRRIGKNFGVRYETKRGMKTRLLYNEGFARLKAMADPAIDNVPLTARYASKTSLISRLKAKRCEICGNENCDLEIHHVRKLKDLKGKSYWEKHMIARRRKTLALCVECHDKLHSGKLN